MCACNDNFMNTAFHENGAGRGFCKTVGEASDSLQAKLSDYLNNTYCGSQEMLAVRLTPQGPQQVFCFKEPADLGTASQLTVMAALMFMQVASAHTDRQGSGK